MGKKNYEEAKKKKGGILCTTLENNSGKIIFEDNTLCCQFLNDYVDLPHFKDVRPEDIEDVSAEFVPQFSNERQADRVKEIKIRGEKGKTSFFLISLIEHKSDVRIRNFAASAACGRRRRKRLKPFPINADIPLHGIYLGEI